MLLISAIRIARKPSSRTSSASDVAPPVVELDEHLGDPPDAQARAAVLAEHALTLSPARPDPQRSRQLGREHPALADLAPFLAADRAVPAPVVPPVAPGAGVEQQPETRIPAGDGDHGHTSRGPSRPSRRVAEPRRRARGAPRAASRDRSACTPCAATASARRPQRPSRAERRVPLGDHEPVAGA